MSKPRRKIEPKRIRHQQRREAMRFGKRAFLSNAATGK
jgi:hypothetical protein